jgi:hypothetical protein
VTISLDGTAVGGGHLSVGHLTREPVHHAMAWSYDLLDDTEKTVLDRCSVFAGGFDLQSACAVAGSDDLDEYAILEVLDALVRKSLLIADRSSGRTRFSMLETIRQFAEEQLVAGGQASEVRTAHARYFAGRETDILALWDSPRQRDCRFRVQSPHRGGGPGNQHRGRSPPPCPRRPHLRIARPRGPNDDHRRHGSVCIRPNRPGPNRTECRLEIVVGPLWGRRVSGKIGGGRSPRSSVLGAGEPVK